MPTGPKISKSLVFWTIVIVLIAQIPSGLLFYKVSEMQEALGRYDEILALEPADSSDIEFVAKLKQEANLTQDIQILVGPYKRVLGSNLKHNLEQHLVFAEQSETAKETFLILFDKALYHKLNGESRKAILAHEVGHIISLVSGKRTPGLNEELNIDNYASRYVRPEVLIGLYQQYEGDETARKLRIENLERQKLISKTVGES